MDFRLLDYSLKSNNLRISLSKIYGIGLVRSSYICNLLGLGKSMHIYFLNKYLKDSFRYIFLQHTYLLSDYLKFFVVQRFELYCNLWTYKGLRFKRGLPMNGQRTSSNSRSVRRFVKKWKYLVKNV